LPLSGTFLALTRRTGWTSFCFYCSIALYLIFELHACQAYGPSLWAHSELQAGHPFADLRTRRTGRNEYLLCVLGILLTEHIGSKLSRNEKSWKTIWGFLENISHHDVSRGGSTTQDRLVPFLLCSIYSVVIGAFFIRPSWQFFAWWCGGIASGEASRPVSSNIALSSVLCGFGSADGGALVEYQTFRGRIKYIPLLGSPFIYSIVTKYSIAHL